MLASMTSIPSQRTPSIYLTGFGPFEGVVDNPSARVAQALNQTVVGGARVDAEVLPVSFERAIDRVIEGYRRLQPDLAVHLGVATRRRLLCIEDRAHNLMTGRVPDVDGRRPRDEAIDASRPPNASLRSEVDTRKLVRELLGHGVPARLSHDAGRYVCNRVYHQGLALGAMARPACRVLFLHLPPVGALPARGAEPWTVQTLRDSVELVLEALQQT